MPDIKYQPYTEETRKALKELKENKSSAKALFTMNYGAALMDMVGNNANALQEILSSLQRIEAILEAQKTQ